MDRIICFLKPLKIFAILKLEKFLSEIPNSYNSSINDFRFNRKLYTNLKLKKTSQDFKKFKPMKNKNN